MKQTNQDKYYVIVSLDHQRNAPLYSNGGIFTYEKPKNKEYYLRSLRDAEQALKELREHCPSYFADPFKRQPPWIDEVTLDWIEKREWWQF